MCCQLFDIHSSCAELAKLYLLFVIIFCRFSFLLCFFRSSIMCCAYHTILSIHTTNPSSNKYESFMSLFMCLPIYLYYYLGFTYTLKMCLFAARWHYLYYMVLIEKNFILKENQKKKVCEFYFVYKLCGLRNLFSKNLLHSNVRQD